MKYEYLLYNLTSYIFRLNDVFIEHVPATGFIAKLSK